MQNGNGWGMQGGDGLGMPSGNGEDGVGCRMETLQDNCASPAPAPACMSDPTSDPMSDPLLEPRGRAQGRGHRVPSAADPKPPAWGQHRTPPPSTPSPRDPPNSHFPAPQPPCPAGGARPGVWELAASRAEHPGTGSSRGIAAPGRGVPGKGRNVNCRGGRGEAGPRLGALSKSWPRASVSLPRKRCFGSIQRFWNSRDLSGVCCPLSLSPQGHWDRPHGVFGVIAEGAARPWTKRAGRAWIH